MSALTLVLLIIALSIGITCGYFLRKKIASIKVDSIEKKVQSLITEAKSKEREIIHQAKDKAYSLLEKSKKLEEDRRREINHLQQRLEKRESIFDKKILSLETKQHQLGDKAQKIEKIKDEIVEIKNEQIEKLQKIASLSKKDAQEILLNKVEDDMQSELLQRIRKLQNSAAEELERQAKKMLTDIIFRCATSHVSDVTTTMVTLPSDEMKGRIIGREGRNIKAIEQLTGVEIIIDDTPLAITISGFNPIRRHVAKKALDSLINDGRIHPARIEEAIDSAKKDIARDIKKSGEEAAYQAGVAGLDPKLLQILGRLKYRTSYGQNVLLHSIEVAHLSAMLATELGANTAVAKKGGLLHDIGKALDHDIPGTHTEIGRDIGKKFKLPPEIIAPIYEHHDDMPSTLEAVIVKVADAISASRMGARNATQEMYLQRLNELEDLATNFEGVDKAYAIQAGREIRVFVNPDDKNDFESLKLAKDIAIKIEEELKYPGEIKINMIREKRIIEYAR